MNAPLTTETVIPGWMSCSEKDERGEELTPLERFVLDNEPAGIGEEVAFLAGLAAVLKPLNDEIARLRSYEGAWNDFMRGLGDDALANAFEYARKWRDRTGVTS